MRSTSSSKAGACLRTRWNTCWRTSRARARCTRASSTGWHNLKDIESALLEARVFPPPPEFTAQARIKPSDLEALTRQAETDYVGFWARQARHELVWQKPFTVTLDDSNAPNFRW